MYPWLADAWQLFTDRLVEGRLPHAILLQGPAGTGKHQLALAMAETLLCIEPREPPASCGECRSCALFRSGAHPEWFPLAPREGKHQITVEAVRELTSALGFTTTISPRKVALLSPAEAMNRNAANALLKSLEEPPGETVLLLVAHDPTRLPVTIRSRCQTISVALPEWSVGLAWLASEKSLEPASAQAAMAAAGGAPLRAAGYAESGQVEEHQKLQASLERLRRRPQAATSMAAELAAIPADTLWQWLSTAAAGALREASRRRAGFDRHAARQLSLLQQAADRNRLLAQTAVRQDLLIQRWLIEWAAQETGREQG
jgi:DNA polymerase-3 subunit delta'